MSAEARSQSAAVPRWVGRVLALLLLLFWGAFFVEHLTEWFLNVDGAYPPPWVWFQQLCHLGMLVGLALMLRRERLGTAILAIGTLGFALVVWDVDVLPILSINLVPILWFAAMRWVRPRPPIPAM